MDHGQHKGVSVSLSHPEHKMCSGVDEKRLVDGREIGVGGGWFGWMDGVILTFRFRVGPKTIKLAM